MVQVRYLDDVAYALGELYAAKRGLSPPNVEPAILILQALELVYAQVEVGPHILRDPKAVENYREEVALAIAHSLMTSGVVDIVVGQFDPSRNTVPVTAQLRAMGAPLRRHD